MLLIGFLYFLRLNFNNCCNSYLRAQVLIARPKVEPRLKSKRFKNR